MAVILVEEEEGVVEVDWWGECSVVGCVIIGDGVVWVVDVVVVGVIWVLEVLGGVDDSSIHQTHGLAK